MPATTLDHATLRGPLAWLLLAASCGTPPTDADDVLDLAPAPEVRVTLPVAVPEAAASVVRAAPEVITSTQDFITPDDRPAPPEVPPWDRGKLDATARQIADAPARQPVWLLAWDLREKEDYVHRTALVAVEFREEGRPMWLVALLWRHATLDRWSLARRSDWRRFRLDHRPTSAELMSLMLPVTVRRCRLDRQPCRVLEGAVVKDTWRELTGEAPPPLYAFLRSRPRGAGSAP